MQPAPPTRTDSPFDLALELPLAPDLGATARDTALFAACALHALAREEARGRRPRRLLEPEHATWSGFRGRLDARDLFALVLEDAAVTQPGAFTPPPVLGRSEQLLYHRLPESLARNWLDQFTALAASTSDTSISASDPVPDYIASQARRLDIPTRMARSKLHKLEPHHRALELPGTGGQLAFHIANRQSDIHLGDVFTIACATWRESLLAALIAVELGITGPAPTVAIPPADTDDARLDNLIANISAPTRIDYVLGLSPEKVGDKAGDKTGDKGAFDQAALQARFPNATVILV